MTNKHDEVYLNLCRKILAEGNKRADRTLTGTTSLFGERIEFDLKNTFPLLTTKRVYWKGVVEELLWFLSGSSDVKILHKNNIHIWDGNTSEEFIRKNNLHVEPNDIGAGYGFQWRHSGAPYEQVKNIRTNGQLNLPEINKELTEQNTLFVDQIDQAITLIKNEPWSRRIIVDAWDPVTIKNKQVALPPCHCLFQFYVNDGKLSCQMYQRSCDVFLGLPFNIASYALITYMIAHLTNLKPDRLVIVLGDVHIYNNHINQVMEQLDRTPYDEPQLKINKIVETINDFMIGDFDLTYKTHRAIRAPMAV